MIQPYQIYLFIPNRINPMHGRNSIEFFFWQFYVDQNHQIHHHLLQSGCCAPLSWMFNVICNVPSDIQTKYNPQTVKRTHHSSFAARRIQHQNHHDDRSPQPWIWWHKSLLSALFNRNIMHMSPLPPWVNLNKAPIYHRTNLASNYWRNQV